MHVIDVLFDQRSFHRIIFKIGRVFHHAPHIPAPLMEFLSDILPVLFALMGILHGIIGALLIVTAADALQYHQNLAIEVTPFYLLLNGMLAVANGLFMLMSYSDVRRRHERGWKSLILISIIAILQTAFISVYFPQSLLSSVLMAVISLYIAYEFKPYFRNVE